MSFSRSLFHEFTPLFRILQHHSNAAHSARIGARFFPGAACSAAHIGRRSNLWDQDTVNPWRNGLKWEWSWEPAHWKTGGNGTRPDIDMVEHQSAYVIEADLPGVKKGGLSVNVGDEGWSLTVEGRRNTGTASVEKMEGKEAPKETNETAETDALVSERTETFMRKVWFSQVVDGQGVKAKLEDGVLRLYVPKKMDGNGSVKVEIA